MCVFAIFMYTQIVCVFAHMQAGGSDSPTPLYDVAWPLKRGQAFFRGSAFCRYPPREDGVPCSRVHLANISRYGTVEAGSQVRGGGRGGHACSDAP